MDWFTGLVATGDGIFLLMGEIQEQLFAVFDFTLEDLQANQAGMMTDSQQQQIKPSILGYGKKVALTVTVVLIGTVLGTIELVLNPLPIFDRNIPVGIGIIVIITLIFLGLLYFYELQALVDARNATVDSINGSIAVREIDLVSGTVSKLVIRRKHTFGELSQEQLNVIRQINESADNPKVTVYCTPRTRKLLSIEFPQKGNHV